MRWQNVPKKYCNGWSLHDQGVPSVVDWTVQCNRLDKKLTACPSTWAAFGPSSRRSKTTCNWPRKDKGHILTLHGANGVAQLPVEALDHCVRTTRVRAIPSPEVAIGVQSCDPAVVVKQEVGLRGKLRRARKEASVARRPVRNSCPRLGSENARRVSMSFPASKASTTSTPGMLLYWTTKVWKYSHISGRRRRPWAFSGAVALDSNVIVGEATRRQ